MPDTAIGLLKLSVLTSGLTVRLMRSCAMTIGVNFRLTPNG